MKTPRVKKIKRWQDETINLTYQKIQEMSDKTKQKD